MQEWATVFSVMGAAAATLLGLLFVAVSIHSGALGRMHQNSRLWAEQAFQNYLLVMLVSLLTLFPSLSIPNLGFVTLALTSIRCVLGVRRLYHVMMQPYGETSRLQQLRGISASLIGFVLLLSASARMAFDWGDSRTTFAIGVQVLLFSATTIAWELLLRISAEKRP